MSCCESGKSCGNNKTYTYKAGMHTEVTGGPSEINAAEELTIGVLFTRIVYLEKTVDNLTEATSTILEGLQELTEAFETIGEVLNEEENPGPKHGGRIEYKSKFTGEHLPDDLDKGGHD